jgi:Domain of unknown function (DUF4388)
MRSHGDADTGKQDLVDRLVMIQPTGVAQPVGEIAADELCFRAGKTMRVMTTPPELLLLHDVEAPAILLAGEIQSASRIHDVCSMAAQARWRGQLVMATDEATRYLFINDGYVVGAYSTAGPERLGAVLVRLGEMTDAQVDETMRVVGDGVRFGDAAVELGFVSRESLYRYLVKQTEQIVFSTVSVQHGTFAFLDDYDDGVLTFPLSIPLTELLMEGVRRMDEMGFFRNLIPSDAHVPVRAHEDGPAVDDPAVLVWNAIDGKRSVETVAQIVGQEIFDTTRTIYELLKKRRISIREPREGGVEGIVEVFNEALGLIMTEVNKYPGASRDIRDSLASFAASGVVYDPIFRGAGPSAIQGTLDVDAVAANMRALPNVDNPERTLAEWLYEYASFAMFIAEPVLRAGPRSDATAITAHVSTLLAPLAPEL